MKTAKWLRGCGAAAAVCLSLVLAGCDTAHSREPLGEAVTLSDKDAAAARMLDTLYSRLWLIEDDKGLAVLSFSRVDHGRCTLKLTGLGEEYELSAKESKKDGLPEEKYECLLRSWDGKLILHEMVDDGDEEKKKNGAKYSRLYLVWLEEDKEGNTWVCGVEPDLASLKKARTGADGKDVKLEIVENQKKSPFQSTYTITSSEAQIRAYLAACKPEDIYPLKAEDGEKKDRRFAKAAKVNINYKGRPEFRKRVDKAMGDPVPAE